MRTADKDPTTPADREGRSATVTIFSRRISVDWAIRGRDLTYDLRANPVEPVIYPTDRVRVCSRVYRERSC